MVKNLFIPFELSATASDADTKTQKITWIRLLDEVAKSTSNSDDVKQIYDYITNRNIYVRISEDVASNIIKILKINTNFQYYERSY